MASREANKWWAKLGELAHYHVEKDAAMAGFDAGREPLLAENRKLLEALHEITFFARHAPDCSQQTESEQKIACSCGLTQMKNRAVKLLLPPIHPTPAPGRGEREKS